jgi:molecular chaperone GrpE
MRFDKDRREVFHFMGNATLDNLKQPSGGHESSEEQIARLKEEVGREHELYLRSLADFKNYRRRAERELANATLDGKREVLLAVLSIMDDFDRALEHIGEASEPVAEGLRAIHRSLGVMLWAQGVTPFESVGQVFDPTIHDAVAVVDDGEALPGTVYDEIRRGYRWENRLLRPAKVRVVRSDSNVSDSPTVDEKVA